MFNKSDIKRNGFQLFGGQAKKGYDWWWHSFTAIDEVTKEEKPFYIEFFICNPKKAKDLPTFGQLGETPSYLMVNVGTWGKNNKGQFHRFFPWNEVKIKTKGYIEIEAKDCYLSEEKLVGKVEVKEEDSKMHPEWMSDAGSLEFNLKIKKQISFNVGYGAGALFRKLQLFEMFWHAEGMKSTFDGYIIFNGRKYLVLPDSCNGYSDKNWGKDFTSPWVWLSSNDLTSEITGKKLENSVFDIGGGCPKVGFISLPRKLLSAVYYEGKEYEFNFSKFWTGCRTKFNCFETDKEISWHVEQTARKDKIVVDMSCKKEDMLLINYEAPNGKKLHNRLWNGGNGKGNIKIYHKNELVDSIVVRRAGCEYGEYC